MEEDVAAYTKEPERFKKLKLIFLASVAHLLQSQRSTGRGGRAASVRADYLRSAQKTLGL